MIIANPIYDIIFKYLLEDTEIAKGLLSRIIGEEILEISVRPQESPTEGSLDSASVAILRFDFVAAVRTEGGEQKKILIEIQKTRENVDTYRFRNYLGEQYKKTDKDTNNQEGMLEIVTIYFLGTRLSGVNTPVLKVKNTYIDVARDKPFVPNPKTGMHEFIRLLNHESYTIQIPRLKGAIQNNLIKILSIFSQEYQTNDKHKLDFTEKVDDPLLQSILNRLLRAASSEDFRKKMDLEDEIERVYQKKLNALKKTLQEKEKTIEEQSKALENKDKALEEQGKALEEQGKALENKDKALEEQGKVLENKDKELAEYKALLAQLLAEREQKK
jgi:hypothetical protein